MVLKFCQWTRPESQPTGDTSRRRSSSSRGRAEEFTVRFNGDAPVGLGFRRAAASGADALECIVSDVLPDSQAAAHNAQRVALGDGAQLLVAGLSSVSQINGRDLRGEHYALVLERMREAKPDLVLSFINGPRRAGGSREKRVAAASLAAKVQPGAALSRPSSSVTRRRMSAITVHDLPATPRRSSVGSDAGIDLRGSTGCALAPAVAPAAALAFRRRSSGDFLALNGVEADASAADALARDLELENEDVKQQLEAARAQLAAELQEREQQRLEQQRRHEHEAREAREALEQLAKARDDMVAVNRVLLSQQRLASKSHRLALERERQDAEVARSELAQVRSDAEGMQQQLEQLQHEKAAATRRSQELLEECRDASRQVEELHALLIEAQREASDARPRSVDGDELEDEDEDGAGSELNRVLRFERRRSASDTAAVDEALSEQRRECQRLRGQVVALESGGAADRRRLSALREELQEAADREQTARSESAARMDVLEQAARRAEAESDELRRELERLRAEQRAREEAEARDGEFLAQFKQQLARGVTLTKFGARGGAPHARVVFADAACRWLSWRVPSAATPPALPRADARVDVSDLVGVVGGAATEAFLRQAVAGDAAATCLSLVLLNPCRTLDLQAESADQRRALLRGFRLLCAEAAATRQRLLLGAADASARPLAPNYF